MNKLPISKYANNIFLTIGNDMNSLTVLLNLVNINSLWEATLYVLLN